MVPTELLPPATVSTSQFTAVLEVLETVATKALNTVPVLTVAVAGETVTVMLEGGGGGVGATVVDEPPPAQPARIIRKKEIKTEKGSSTEMLFDLIFPHLDNTSTRPMY